MPHKIALPSDGFTLLELLIALTLAALLAAAGYTFYITQYRAKTQQERVTEMQQNLRSAMEMMARDIRMAGYDPTGNAGTGITAATATRLSFTYAIDGPSTGEGDDGEEAALTYSVGNIHPSGGFGILRSLDGGAHVVVGEHMEALEFNYVLKDGTSSASPMALDDIIAVRVALLARTPKADADFKNTQTYVGYEGAWGPFNDGYRRRLLLRTIQCRNQGFNNAR